MDVLLALTAIALLWPIALIVSLLVRWNLGSPVLFRQQRGGLGGETFEMLKFRTMTDAQGVNGELLSNEERKHPFGERLRSTSLDELPALLNVVRGDMSMVGPRPLLVSYLERYSDEEARRHCVRPGITGLAQVKGRNTVSWDEKFAFDLAYVDNLNFRGDLLVLLQTVTTVLSRNGADGNELATEFFGAGFSEAEPCTDGLERSSRRTTEG